MYLSGAGEHDRSRVKVANPKLVSMRWTSAPRGRKSEMPLIPAAELVAPFCYCDRGDSVVSGLRVANCPRSLWRRWVL